MGAERSCQSHARVETAGRVSAKSLERVQRGVDSLFARTRFAQPSAVEEKLCGLDLKLSLAQDLWTRILVRRTVVHPPVFAHLGRFSRHPGRVHARQGKRLLRKQ